MTLHRMERREANTTSALQIYLHDINDTPLLSAQEEKELAERVSVGDPLAREHMVKANLRLVVNIARGYLGKGLNLEDLIEEGNLGLMRAVEGFDGTMNTRFSTYASYWIKQSIRRAVMNNGKPIRLPAYMVSLLSKWRRATAVLGDRLGRAPTHEEVGKALRLSPKKIGIVAKAIRVNNLMPHSENLEENGPALDDVLTDDRNKGAETLLIEADDLDRIFDYLSSLEDREATVVRMRFGLDHYNPMTLREVGENLGLTRERVRQLESQALQKLMHALAETSETGKRAVRLRFLEVASSRADDPSESPRSTNLRRPGAFSYASRNTDSRKPLVPLESMPQIMRMTCFTCNKLSSHGTMTWSIKSSRPRTPVLFYSRPLLENGFNPIFWRLDSKNQCGAVESGTKSKAIAIHHGTGRRRLRVLGKEENFKMVCSMIKKGVLGTALGAGTLFLVFGTSAPSYVKTAFHKVRQNVKESVDPQFEIERARQDIDNLQPMFDQHKERLARAEVDAESLGNEVGRMQASLEKSKQTILSMQQKLKTGDFRLTGHIVDTADSVKADLADRLDHYDYTVDTLKQKQEVLRAKQQIIRAAHEQLTNLRTQKTTLLAKLSNIEAKLRVLEAKQTKNEFNFDDGSTLSRAKQTISDLEKRLNVMSHRAEIDGRYGDLDQPASSYVDPRRDVVKEVEDKFGEASKPSAKAGDKSL